VWVPSMGVEAHSCVGRLGHKITFENKWCTLYISRTIVVTTQNKLVKM
jgi:hypothetical protein